MRFIFSTLTLFSAIIFCPPLFAVIDMPCPVEDGDLIHVTKWRMTSSRAVPGAVTGGKIVDREKCPDVRCTLHHCYMGMVPDAAMQSVGIIGGYLFSTTSGANNGRAYAWIDRLSHFEGEVIGSGGPADVFTGAHTYGEGSVVLIPVGEVEDFRTDNPDFAGDIQTYTPEDNFRERINEILLMRNGVLLSYRDGGLFAPGDPILGFAPHIEDEDVDLTPFKTYLDDRRIFLGHHNYSPFGQYETILIELRRPFMGFDLVKYSWPDTIRNVPSEENLISLLSLYDFVTIRLRNAVTHALTNDSVREEIDQWLDYNEAFVKLFRIDLVLRDQKKSLFFGNENFPEYFARRADLDVEGAASSLPELTEQQIAEWRGHKSDLEVSPLRFLSLYLTTFACFDPLLTKEIAEHTTLSRVKKVAFQLHSLFRLYWHYSEPSQELIDTFDATLIEWEALQESSFKTPLEMEKEAAWAQYKAKQSMFFEALSNNSDANIEELGHSMATLLTRHTEIAAVARREREEFDHESRYAKFFLTDEFSNIYSNHRSEGAENLLLLLNHPQLCGRFKDFFYSPLPEDEQYSFQDLLHSFWGKLFRVNLDDAAPQDRPVIAELLKSPPTSLKEAYELVEEFYKALPHLRTHRVI